jgi:thiol-disulfide isomerase/thioredoxin
LKRIIFIAIAFGLNLCSLQAQEIPKWKITELVNYIAKSEGPVVINFWATYCVPCIKEIPMFEKVIKEYESKGVKMLLVSLDFEESYPAKISEFVKKRKFRSPVTWLNETNADYFCPKVDSKWSGVMPATLFINNKTGYRHFLEEEIIKEKFEREIQKLIQGH